MAGLEVLETIARYLDAVRSEGIEVTAAFLFGSQARGQATAESDIDVLVVSPAFDRADARTAWRKLWKATVVTRGHIEPVGCGEERWRSDGGSPLLEIVRREGIPLELHAPAP